MTIKNSTNCFHEFENIREESIEKLKKNGFNDIDPTLTHWTEYMTDLLEYKFCLSLPGKGLDCYRTWEAISIGVIPIVISTHLDELYKDLPIIIVNDISVVTSEFLNDKFKEISSKIEEYRWEKLSSSYWVHKIKSELNLRRNENDLEKVIEHVKYSIENADNHGSKLNEHILDFNGFSGSKTRHFYNNICSMDHCRYLEIGTGAGSSSISSMFGNKISAVLIDDFSESSLHEESLLNEIEKYKGKNEYELITKNCWCINPKTLSKTFNTYIYDGNHSYKDQYNAIKHYYDVLEENCIIIIDDWNRSDVRNGTLDAFRDLGTNLKFQYEINTKEPHYINGKDNWWAGCGIFVIGKTI